MHRFLDNRASFIFKQLNVMLQRITRLYYSIYNDNQTTQLESLHLPILMQYI
jgi:hypothetical protein